MPPYQWTLIKPERHDKDTKEESTKDTKGTKDASLHSENEGAHKTIDLLTRTPHQEGHVSNVDRWATLPETAQGRKGRRASTSLTIMTRNRSISHLSPCHGTAWPQ